MACRNTNEPAFTAIRIDGGLLAVDFPNRIAHFQTQEQSDADLATMGGPT